MTEYVLQDKSLAIKWALTFEDGQIDWSSTSNAASADIIVEDSVNAGVYWTISIDDGEFNWDLAGAQDDVVVIDDSVLTGESYRLYVSDGELEWLSYVLIEPSVLNTEGTLHAPQINLDVVVTPTVIDGRGALGPSGCPDRLHTPSDCEGQCTLRDRGGRGRGDRDVRSRGS